MKKNSFGISLISLIITVIVIIILAAIVIFTGLGTPDSANFAKFASEFSDFNLAVDNAYMKEFQDNALENEQRSKKQVYYKIATGTDVGMNGDVHPAGDIATLGTTYPENLKGTEYYRITSDTNVLNWKAQKQYFEETEAHYVTDEGEAFFLPGYLVQEDDGTQKWWINESKYYIGDKKSVDGGSQIVLSPEEQGRLDAENVKVLTSAEIVALGNANLKNSTIKMVLQGEGDTGVVPVPMGFEYVTGTEQAGLVIKDKNDNEFVWIPVTNPKTMYYESDEAILMEEGVVTTTTKRWGKGTTSNPMYEVTSTDYREPDILPNYDTNTSYLALAGFEGTNALQDFADDLVTEFNNMIDSVIKYKGFYVGRYELGYDDGIVCKSGVDVLTSAEESGFAYYGSETTCMWYGLYRACKTFTAGGVQSGMIWGCQWDAMVDFIGDHTFTTFLPNPSNRQKTGMYGDVAKNVHDTSTSAREATTVVKDSYIRGGRGGYDFGGWYAASYRYPNRADEKSGAASYSGGQRFSTSALYKIVRAKMKN